MARLFLILMFSAVAVAIVAFVVSFLHEASEAGRRTARQVLTRNGDEMIPPGLQKGAYVALIVLMFGVASGWLGGL